MIMETLETSDPDIAAIVTREEERQRELQELAEREGERYKQRQKDAQALKQAEAHAQMSASFGGEAAYRGDPNPDPIPIPIPNPNPNPNPDFHPNTGQAAYGGDGAPFADPSGARVRVNF